jgi:hypothetical protein
VYLQCRQFWLISHFSLALDSFDLYDSKES